MKESKASRVNKFARLIMEGPVNIYITCIVVYIPEVTPFS